MSEENKEESSLKITSLFEGIKPVTDFTVTFAVISEDNFFKLTPKQQELIGLYASDFKRLNGHVCFAIATYRLIEIGITQDKDGKFFDKKG